jgi:hypothetical protein
LIENVLIYQNTLVNTMNPGAVILSQDPAPVETSGIYVRESTTVMSDLGNRGGQNLWAFGGRPASSGSGGTDMLFHIVDHTFVARSESCVNEGQVAGIMSAGQRLGWDLQYLGTAADPTSRAGAVFEYDADIEILWDTGGADGDWPEIRSPLVGLERVIGRSPHAL